MEESTPTGSSKWVPTTTFAHEMAVLDNKQTHRDPLATDVDPQP